MNTRHTAPVEDMHGHPTFSAGRGNVVAASAIRLEGAGGVDPVRGDARWVPELVQEVKRCGRNVWIQVLSGVETTLLDEHGTLDAPADLTGVDFLYTALQGFPIGDTVYAPRDVRTWLQRGEIKAGRLFRSLVNATIACLKRYDRVVLARLFSLLPKVGLREDDVPEDLIAQLGEAAASAGAAVEVDERWRYPSVRTARVLAASGVRLLASSARDYDEITGRHPRITRVLEALQGA